MGYLLSSLLLINAVWNTLVWPQFFVRVKRDERSRDESGKVTKFFVVHAILVSVSLTIALLSLVVALTAIFFEPS